MVWANFIKGKGLIFLIIVLYVFVGFLAYLDVLLNGIFLFDDFEYVVGNPLIQGFSALRLSDPRQVGYLSFAINYAIGGENPFGYHLGNIIIHIINAVLTFFIVKVILNILRPEEDNLKTTMAFLAGIIFLVHPVQTQAVSYVTQRFTSLCTLFYLLSVLLYLIARARLEKNLPYNGAYALYIISILSTLLAMKTKEISFTIPFILFVFELLLFKNSVYQKRRFIYLIPYMATLIIIPLSLLGPEWGLIKPAEGIAEVVRKDKLYDLTVWSPYRYLLTQFNVIVTYIRLLLLPVNLKAVYEFKISDSIFELRVLFSVFLLLVIAVYAIYSWRRSFKVESQDASDHKLVAIGITWFFITLSVESSVIPIKDIIFEHRVYLPSVGFIASCSVLLLRFVRRINIGLSDTIKISAITLIITVPLAIGTYMRNEVWTDELKFWDDVVKKSPNKAIGYNNRGNAYAKVGQYDLALRDINKTISYFPKDTSERLKWENADFTPTNMAKTYMNRGQIYATFGDMEKANADFDRARQVMTMPVDVGGFLKQGDIYSRYGMFSLAIEEYNKVLQWNPEDIDALNNRGNAYSRSGRYDEAIVDLDRVISLRHDFVLAYHNRGIAYAWMGNNNRAIEDFKVACRMGFKPSCDSIDILLSEVEKGR